jgi:membrane protease subunit (stomatin/prohibitin family)
MEFQKIIKVSEKEVIEEICDYYSNEKTFSFIKQILPRNPYGSGHDVDFLSTLMIDLSNKMVKSLDGELKSDAKKLYEEIVKFRDKFYESEGY